MQLPRSVPLGGCLLTVFLMICSLGLLGVLAVPAVGEALGPLVCADGEEMTNSTETFYLPGETRQSVTYFCQAANSQQREVGFGELIFAGLKVYVLFFALVVFPLVTLGIARVRRKTRDFMPDGGIKAMAERMRFEVRQAREPPPPRSGQTPAERLRALDSLHAEGLLTDAEYAAKKAEILREL